MIDQRLLKRGLAILAATAAVLTGGSAAAQPNEVSTLNLTLNYDGRLFVKVLDIGFQEQITPYGHSSSARLVSSGLLAAFRKIDLSATTQGRMVRGEPQPGQLHTENIDGKKNRKIWVTWGETDVITRSVPEITFWGDPPATQAEKLAAADPLTQLTRLILASTAQGPCQGASPYFNGKELYNLGFSNPRPAEVNGPDKRLGLVNGLRCEVVYKEVAGYKKKKEKDRNQGMNQPILVDFAQMGPGGPWVVTMLRAHTPLGTAVIDLVRVKMTGQRP